jgi:hypothetical protein
MNGQCWRHEGRIATNPSVRQRMDAGGAVTNSARPRSSPVPSVKVSSPGNRTAAPGTDMPRRSTDPDKAAGAALRQNPTRGGGVARHVQNRAELHNRHLGRDARTPWLSGHGRCMRHSPAVPCRLNRSRSMPAAGPGLVERFHDRRIDRPSVLSEFCGITRASRNIRPCC